MPELGGTTALLLLIVFAIVNVSVLVLRRRPIDHPHFQTPTVLPVLGAASCIFLVSPLVDRPVAQYRIAAVLLGLGAVLWLITWFLAKRRGGRGPTIDPEHLVEK